MNKKPLLIAELGALADRYVQAVQALKAALEDGQITPEQYDGIIASEYPQRQQPEQHTGIIEP